MISWSTLLATSLWRNIVSATKRSNLIDSFAQSRCLACRVTKWLWDSLLTSTLNWLRWWLRIPTITNAPRLRLTTTTLASRRSSPWTPRFSTISLAQTELVDPGPSGCFPVPATPTRKLDVPICASSRDCLYLSNYYLILNFFSKMDFNAQYRHELIKHYKNTKERDNFDLTKPLESKITTIVLRSDFTQP